MASRREFMATAAGGLLAAVPFSRRRGPEDGRFTARPHRPASRVEPGLHELDPATGRDGILYVPERYQPAQPAPFVLWLHGAGGYGRFAVLPWWKQKCDELGIVVLAPNSRDRTWDGALGGFGPDIAFIDRMLARVFDQVAVQRSRLTIAGFSDGASYALSAGLVNGDLFQRIVAFSPGFIVPAEWHGTPEFFISHGRQDPILPIDQTSRRIVQQVQRGGYRVRYREFDGGHMIPPEIRDEAVSWAVER
jgi:phospholipase/carboxylesterase